MELCVDNSCQEYQDLAEQEAALRAGEMITSDLTMYLPSNELMLPSEWRKSLITGRQCSNVQLQTVKFDVLLNSRKNGRTVNGVEFLLWLKLHKIKPNTIKAFEIETGCPYFIPDGRLIWQRHDHPDLSALPPYGYKLD